jgi:hypothetical protein
VQHGVSSQEMKEQWRKDGGLTLRQEGVLVALEGRTSLEEVLGSTYSDGEDIRQVGTHKAAPAPHVEAAGQPG